jgi:RES domain-containing protein
MPRERPTVISWSGDAFRATSYDMPLWVNSNRRHGRWNLAGDGCTQYLCLDAQAPFAEMLRAENLRTPTDVSSFRTTVWQLRIDEGAIVDYSTFEKAEGAGFPPDALIDDDHERCQAEALRLRQFGVSGLLTPSAALPDSVNLTLFGARSPIRWTTTVKLASTIPVQRLTEGNAPVGLEKRVRYFGEAHAGYELYVKPKLFE